MDSELSNEAGNEFKILGPLIKDTKVGSKRRSNGACSYTITSEE